jgi:hypothetical protein
MRRVFHPEINGVKASPHRLRWMLSRGALAAPSDPWNFDASDVPPRQNGQRFDAIAPPVERRSRASLRSDTWRRKYRRVCSSAPNSRRRSRRPYRGSSGPTRTGVLDHRPYNPSVRDCPRLWRRVERRDRILVRLDLNLAVAPIESFPFVQHLLMVRVQRPWEAAPLQIDQ